MAIASQGTVHRPWGILFQNAVSFFFQGHLLLYSLTCCNVYFMPSLLIQPMYHNSMPIGQALFFLFFIIFLLCYPRMTDTDTYGRQLCPFDSKRREKKSQVNRVERQTIDQEVLVVTSQSKCSWDFSSPTHPTNLSRSRSNTLPLWLCLRPPPPTSVPPVSYVVRKDGLENVVLFGTFYGIGVVV